MSSDEPGNEGWLEIRGNPNVVEGAGSVGAVVTCPFRGECALAVCVDCTHFAGLQADAASYVVCTKAERAPRAREVLLQSSVRAPGGEPWKVTAYGRQRGDGTWDGWLEWLAPDGRTTRCGGCEANERCRNALLAWARGLSEWNCRGLLMAHEALRDRGA